MTGASCLHCRAVGPAITRALDFLALAAGGSGTVRFTCGRCGQTSRWRVWRGTDGWDYQPLEDTRDATTHQAGEGATSARGRG